MPSFETPEPIAVTIETGVAAIRIAAGDRSTTDVTVAPSNPADEGDVRTAERTQVDFSGGVLTIKTPRNRLDFSKKIKSIDITVELPRSSTVDGSVAVGDFHCTGTLATAAFRSSAGDVQVEHTGPLTVHTSAGRVTAERVDGPAEITTGSGAVRVGAVTGSIGVKNSNGLTEIGTATGEVRVNAANGDVVIGRALGDRVDAKTANGNVRIGEVDHGEVGLRTAMGDLEVGITAGVPTWLDVNTTFGRLRNELGNTGGAPAPGEPSVQVRAHTSFGDVIVRRVEN
jgi:DUF4097 and DUF4098 domain-containing protein YvlB